MRSLSRRAPLGAVILPALALGLAACSGGDEAPVTGGTGSSPQACDAARFQDRIGGPLLASAAPPPASGPFLRVSELPHPQRILPPGAIVTKDMRPDRINVHIDATGRITQIVCG